MFTVLPKDVETATESWQVDQAGDSGRSVWGVLCFLIAAEGSRLLLSALTASSNLSMKHVVYHNVIIELCGSTSSPVIKKQILRTTYYVYFGLEKPLLFWGIFTDRSGNAFEKQMPTVSLYRRQSTRSPCTVVYRCPCGQTTDERGRPTDQRTTAYWNLHALSLVRNSWPTIVSVVNNKDQQTAATDITWQDI